MSNKPVKSFIYTTLSSTYTNQATFGIDSDQIDNYVVYYTIIDLLTEIGGLALTSYFLLQFLVPSDLLFISAMVDRTQTSLQMKAHLYPRFHNMNDSAGEMLTVAKDIFAKRVRVERSSFF